MTPAQALFHLNAGDPDGIVPALYRTLSRDVLRALADEMAPDAGPVEILLRRAIAKPGRLRTPARRQVAFLLHYAGCRSLEEGAARAGIDRRTVTRWRRASRAFHRRLCRLQHAAAQRRRRAMSP